MDGAWHFVRDGEPRGPMDGRGVLELYAEGLIDDTCLVWTDGMEAWAPLRDTELADALPPATKRRRGDAASAAPDEELQAEIPGWVAALDQPSLTVLFERALFEHLGDVIQWQRELRDALLTAYVSRHPASDDRDPANYQFSDDFLLEAVEDLEDQQEMWAVFGEGNEPVVRQVVGAAAALDRRFCGALQNLALLCRARALLLRATAGSAEGAEAAAAAGSGAQGEPAQQLLALLQQEPALPVARDSEGRSLWHDLAAGGQLDLLRLLLPAADGTAAAAGGGGGQPTPAVAAGARGSEQAAAAGSAAADKQPHPLNLPDRKGNTPLHAAAEGSHVEVARLLLDAGASPDMQNRDPSKYAAGDWSVKSRGLDCPIPVPSLHQTPLHIAAEAGDAEMLQLLVGRGALLDVRDSSGSTPLHLALEAQDESAVALLLRAGASPCLSNNDMGEQSTLHNAASAGRPGLLRTLLEAWPAARRDAAVNAPGDNGWTPLMLAARRGSADCARLLLDAGADAAARNAQGRTAADIAAVNKREGVAALLRERAAAAQQAKPAA